MDHLRWYASGKPMYIFPEAKYEHISTFASEHGQNMYVWTIVSNLLLLWLSASVKLKLLSQNVCVCVCVRWICCFLWSVLVLSVFFYIFHARFCVNFHLLTLSQWNFSERPEKTVRPLRLCGMVWSGMVWSMVRAYACEMLWTGCTNAFAFDLRYVLCSRLFLNAWCEC